MKAGVPGKACRALNQGAGVAGEGKEKSQGNRTGRWEEAMGNGFKAENLGNWGKGREGAAGVVAKIS